jgi:hypothetical protein
MKYQARTTFDASFGFARMEDGRFDEDRFRAVFHREVPKKAGVYAYLVGGVILNVGSSQRDGRLTHNPT